MGDRFIVGTVSETRSRSFDSDYYWIIDHFAIWLLLLLIYFTGKDIVLRRKRIFHWIRNNKLASNCGLQKFRWRKCPPVWLPIARISSSWPATWPSSSTTRKTHPRSNTALRSIWYAGVCRRCSQLLCILNGDWWVIITCPSGVIL